MTATQMNSIKFVVDNSQYVSINKNKINDFTNSVNDLDYEHWSKNIDLELYEKEWILLCFIIESLNFCFWPKPKWEIIYKEQKINGSMAMLYSIIKAVQNKTITLDIEELKKIDKKQFASIFETKYGTLPMIEKRYENFVQTINFFDSNKNIYEELFAIHNDIDLLEYITSSLDSFDDKSNYKGITVSFNKRATLLVNDLYNVSPTIKDNIGNVNNLSGCADYGVPRVFRDFGILEYSKDLSDIIDSERELNHDSEMEIEIRANMLYCIELIKNEFAHKNKTINAVQLDNLIWWFYKKNIGGKSIPHHTITTYY